VSHAVGHGGTGRALLALQATLTQTVRS
jgi:predicted ribonuclease YlaK